MTLKVGVRKAVHAEIQQREAMDTRPAKSPEMSQPKSPGLSRVSLGRWKMVRWLGVKVHEGEVLEGETLTPSCGIPHSCPPTPRSFPGILDLGNTLQSAVELGALNLHGCILEL